MKRKPTELQKHILVYIYDNPDCTKGDVVRHLNKGREGFQAVNRVIDRGWVTSTWDKHKYKLRIADLSSSEVQQIAASINQPPFTIDRNNEP